MTAPGGTARPLTLDLATDETYETLVVALGPYADQLRDEAGDDAEMLASADRGDALVLKIEDAVG